MRVGIVYTSTTPELIEFVEKELREAVGPEAEFISFKDPSILAEVREQGYVTPTATARLVGLYVDAINAGADAILNCCSSVGEAADSVQDMARFTGIPIVRIDEDMCRAAVIAGKRIGVMATLSSTLEPTKSTVLRVAREMNKRVDLIDIVLEGAFGLSQDDFRNRLLTKAREMQDKVDVLLLAQGSMAYCERVIAEATGKPAFSSPRFGAKAVREALSAKGLIV
ncbi:MAG: aspartate/glutamate racemase family protein [Candidatus Accumulibacter sp.]|jgi:Asp/Glu/hydantoin racemase|nr:aspartate/glutamate racemase family protein [Accumulibacter sp.]